MSDSIQTALLTIYSRLAPKIKINGFTTTTENTGSYLLVTLISDDERQDIMLSLFNNEGNDEGIENFRWEYMNANTGFLIESELTHTATDEELLSFLEKGLQIDNSYTGK